MKLLIEQTLYTLARLGNSKQVILFSMLNNDKNEVIAKVVGVCSEGKFTAPMEKFINIMDTPLKKVILTKQSLSYPSILIKQFLPISIPDNIGSNLECLCLPLLNEENQQLKGVVILFQETNSLSSNKCLQTLDTLNSMIAAIIEVDQNNETLTRLATNDVSTGLYTQHYLEMRLQEELARIHRYDGKVSLLLVEIDNFKLVNDTCKYHDSKLMLQEVAKLLTNLIRSKIDLLSNYNDKCFAVLLPGTSVDDACALAERLRQKCEYHLFVTQQGIPIKMTLSIGIAHNVDTVQNSIGENIKSYTDFVSDISKEELIHRAEIMLQAAKQAGNNKVMAWW